MIGIIGAMEVEIDHIQQKIDNLETINKGIKTFYKGSINDKEVVVVLAGIGKVNAAITTTLLIEHFDVKTIINIGVAGGQNGVTHKDVVISNEVLYHDVDVTSFGTYKHGQVPGLDPVFTADEQILALTKTILDEEKISYKIGRIASGDQFITDPKSVQAINKEYDHIYAIEMEAAAIAHVASLNNIPFIVYRSISDVLGDESQSNDFMTFVNEAAIIASKVLEKLIEAL